ncbi:MAG: nitroreductase family protein [Thermoanaerobaculales bacterium]|nr:nitroreductase family protein [Thermoanaerobaculales bacterium]
MTEQLHVVDTETCLGDGICAEICPEDILEMVDEKAATIETRADACILCGQCVAVCPTESLTMPQLPMEDFERLPGQPFEYEDFFDFLKLRRSVRVFKDKPVERTVIQKVLDAAATAPMGFPPHSTEVIVIDERAELDFLREQLVEDYTKTLKAFSSPIGRAMVRLAAGAENFHSLKHHILAVASHANDVYRGHGDDNYMRGAPVLMMFHGNRWAMSYEENAHLVCHHSMLAALSLGLGTTIIGLIPPVVDRSKVLRKRYDIPKDNKVCTSLVLGYPKYRYRRSIRRSLAGIRYH